MKMFLSIVVTAALAAGLEASSLETLQAKRRIAAVRVEGAVNWLKVPAQGAFVKTGTGYVPAPQESSVQVAYDGASLFVRMTMREADASVRLFVTNGELFFFTKRFF